MNQLFVYRVWQRTLVTWLGVAALVYGAHEIYSGTISAWWLLLSYVMIQWFMIGLSVGNHRLFSHGSFKTSRFWQWALALTTVISSDGSAYTWTFIHRGHHIHSDTPKDPYQNNWSYFFRLKHKKIEFDISRAKWMLRDPMHMITHKYASLIMVAYAAILYWISPMLFLFGWLIPASFHAWTGGLLIIYTHKNDIPVDRPWYWGIFIPAAGEWYHRSHHEPGQARRLDNAQLPGQWDFGCWFAKLISK